MTLSKSQIKKAGKILKHKESQSVEDVKWAEDALTYWRTIHGKVINDFHQIVQDKSKEINKDTFVAQRLKRSPSIIGKLQRLGNIQLTTMQDIAGVRAVVNDINEIRLLEKSLKESKIIHELISEDDYLECPKESGYRGIHLIYRYVDSEESESNGLLVEIQIRTKLQHAWATAVETMGTFLGTQLKFNEGQPKWLKYFALTSSAFSFIEKTNQVPKYTKLSQFETFEQTLYEFKYNEIEEKLKVYSLAADFICKKVDENKKYHLVVLDVKAKTVKIQSFEASQFDSANKRYTELERDSSNGNLKQVVLVSTESIHELRDAFPNYFLDTREFLKHMDLIRGQFNKMKITKAPNTRS
jgi:ppGpp synthetase/RelA/SpoT-type nucleotidyltranferase